MQQLPKILESHTKVRFQDCDPFNHLNNANYLNYMINAREDQILAAYDLDIFKMARTQGKSWVSGSNQIAYLKPANLMEMITIDSQLVRYTDTDLLVEIRMWDKPKQQLKAVLWAAFVHFDLLKQKRAIHDPQLLSLFKQVVLPVPANNFEERITLITEGINVKT